MNLQKCIGFLNTPPLWVGEQFGIQQFEFPDIDLTAFKPKTISSKLRLGHQLEYVFKQLITQSNTYEIVLHNLPIRNGKQTLGEIDFILKNIKTKKLIHIELTYKFYLINIEISQLIGPNKRDMFINKVKKIKNKQFQLLHTEEGVKALYKNEIEHTKIKHETCFKGQIFEPYGNKFTNIEPLKTNCIAGYWLRFSDFNTNMFTKNQFYIPSKSEWVITPHFNVKWISHFEISIVIINSIDKEISPMVWMKKSESLFEKFFVVWW